MTKTNTSADAWTHLRVGPFKTGRYGYYTRAEVEHLNKRPGTQEHGYLSINPTKLYMAAPADAAAQDERVITLPTLPEPCGKIGLGPGVGYIWDQDQMADYARAAVLADRAALPAQAVAPVLTDDGFRGDNHLLVSCITALLEMDAAGTLVPHGVGGHARGLLAAAASRLAAPVQDVAPTDTANGIAWQSTGLGITRTAVMVDGRSWYRDDDPRVKAAPPVVAKDVAPSDAQSMPPAVREWIEAHRVYVEATRAYNARLRAIREREQQFPKEFGKDSPQAEYVIMEDAGRASRALIAPMYDALTAAQPATQTAGPETTSMLRAACADLGRIAERLGLDPDDAGADPILAAIDELTAAQPADALAREVEVMVSMIEEKEWAEHVGKTPLGQRLEAAITQLHSDIHDAAEDQPADVQDDKSRLIEHAACLGTSLRDGDAGEATESWASLPNHLVEAIEAAEARIMQGRTQEGAAS